MYVVAFTPNVAPANALSAKHKTLIGAIGELLKTLDVLECDEWFVAAVLEAAKEAVDNLENCQDAKGAWSDMGCEDDAFSIDIFQVDDAKYVKLGDADACSYCGGDCKSDEDNACDGYLGDIDGLDAAVRAVVNAAPTITSVKSETSYGSCTLTALFSDFSERRLFSFFVDELSFNDSELIGLTEAQAHELRHSKDVAYLRS